MLADRLRRGDERIARMIGARGGVSRRSRARARDLTRAASDVGLRDSAISRLPFTRREAMAILSLVAPGQRMQALDFAASRATATSPELAQYPFVHFATHGFASSAIELRARAVLVDARPAAGRLPAREQSSTSSSRGLSSQRLPDRARQEIKGEGLLGLTRAFMSKRGRAASWPACR